MPVTHQRKLSPSISRPGYAQIEAVRRLSSDSVEWNLFMRDVVQMPLSMLSAVQCVVKAPSWKFANDPVKQLRSAAANWAKRRTLSSPDVVREC